MIDGFVITANNEGSAIEADSYNGQGYIIIKNNTFMANHYTTINISLVTSRIDRNIFKNNIGTVLNNKAGLQRPGVSIILSSVISRNIFENNKSINGNLVYQDDGSQHYVNNIFIKNKYERLMNITTMELSALINNNLYVNNNCKIAIDLYSNSTCIGNNIFYNNYNDNYEYYVDLSASSIFWIAARNNIFQLDSISMGLVTSTAPYKNNLYMVDPLFVNVNDPDGPDNIWRTADDGLALQATSPGIDAGTNLYGVPLTDILGLGRTDIPGVGKYINDIGAYEFGGVSVSTEEQVNSPGYRAWPNPATNLLHVSLPAPATTVALVDATGRTVLQAQTQGQSSCDLQIEHLPAGIYFLLIDGYSCNLKIAKN